MGPAAAWSVIRRRATLLREIRQFFDARGFLEVETPVLSRDTVVDRHLDPLPVADPRLAAEAAHAADCDAPAAWYLQTSPEFCMKRLLAAAAKDPDGPLAIYQITRAFRSQECGRLHNPEFTMLEWYEVDSTYQAAIDLVALLACEMIGCPSVRRLSYAEAFRTAVGVDPHRDPVERLRGAARGALGPACPDLDPTDRDSWLQVLMSECVEPGFPSANPVIVYDYPASQAALARVEPQDGVQVARRFELYYRGLELANGYDELLDAEVLLRRNTLVNQQRAAESKRALPVESRLLEAMRQGLPSCSGVALGLDRLLMTICEVNAIQEVLAFPYDRA